MNICITGALGHIGSKLIRNFAIPSLKKVYLVDNFFTQRYSSLFELPSKHKFIFYELDILSKDIVKIIKDSDVIIHLAAITDAESSIEKKGLVNKVNKKGSKYIADLCALYNKSLLFPSTTSVYGSSDTLVDENCQELKPQSPYAQSKLDSEEYLKKLGQTKKLKFAILRLGTIFGYSIGMRFHTAVNKFIFQAVSEQNITIWKTAFLQKRPYCDLNDAITAFNHVVNDKIFNWEIYNIVTKNYTVKDVVETIRKYVPNIKLNFIESRIMNQLSYNVDNRKSLNNGFSYRGNLERSIRQTIIKLKNINTLIKKSGL